MHFLREVIADEDSIKKQVRWANIKQVKINTLPILKLKLFSPFQKLITRSDGSWIKGYMIST